MKRLPLALFFTGMLATLSVSCTEESSMAPIGDGLSFIGVAIVVAVLVAVLGSTLRGGGGPYE